MNWLEKFQAMWKQLNNAERRALYDVLSMVRGPDIETANALLVKEKATARFRFVLFGEDSYGVGGDVNTDGKPLTQQELDDFPLNHYRSHAIDGQIRLVELGVWQTPAWSQPLDEDEEDDSDDADDGDDNGDYP